MSDNPENPAEAMPDLGHLDKGTPLVATEPLVAEYRLKQDAITLPETLAQSVTVMAPAMSGAFITYLAATKAGGATPLSFLLAALAALCIGGVVGEFALSLRSAGSLYTYTVRGLGSFWGHVAAWMYAFGLWLAGPSVLAGSAVFLSLVMQDIGAPAVFEKWWLWFALGILGWLALAYYGIELSTRSSLVFTGFGLAVLLWLAFAVIFQGGAHGNTVQAFSPGSAGVSWPGVFAGVAFGLLSFTGFETSASLAEETRHPRRDVPMAVIGSVVIGGLFYVAVTYATSIGYGVREATTKWPESASGLAPLADTYASYLTDLVLAAVAIDAFFCGLGLLNAVSRILFAMGREGVLPRALGRTHPKHQTPHVAIVTFIAASVAACLLLVGLTPTGTRDALVGGGGPLAAGLYVFTEGLTLITPPIMFGYVLLSLAGFVYGLRENGNGGARQRLVVVSTLAFFASCLAVYGSLYYSFVEAAPGAGIPMPYRVVPWVAVAWMLLAFAVGAWLRSRRRQAWEEMGAVFG